MIDTIFETDTYRYDYDSQYGTGWFVRKADDHVSLMDTGTEAQDMLKSLKYWAVDKCSKCIAEFNTQAESHDFSPRWSNDDESG